MAKHRPHRAPRSKKGFDHFPSGFHTVTPYLAINGASQAIDWYRKLSKRELQGEAGPDGNLIHTRIRLGDSIVMMSDTFPGGHKSVSVRWCAGSPPHIFKERRCSVEESGGCGREGGHAVRRHVLGRTIRQLTDPFGHFWSMSMRIPMSRKQMKEQRAEAMKMFEQGLPEDSVLEALDR